jgi:hypothetical protein
MKFIFVLGCPRSGTTMLGALIGSSPQIFCPGEYFGFYVTRHTLPLTLRRIPSSLRASYLLELQQHAARFALQQAALAGADMFCDATPWNMLVAKSLGDEISNALFVCCVRHPAGVIQSLERSYRGGFRWAGDTDIARARLYSVFYSKVKDLPTERTVYCDYDALCADPEIELHSLLTQVSAHLGVSVASFDRSVLAVGHAPASGSGIPLASVNADGQICFNERESFDTDLWERSKYPVMPALRPGLESLRSVFPRAQALNALH